MSLYLEVVLIFFSVFKKEKFKTPNICKEKIIMITPAVILNSFEKKRRTFPIAEAAAPKIIKTNEKPREKRMVFVKTIDLFLSISPKSFPVI